MKSTADSHQQSEKRPKALLKRVGVWAILVALGISVGASIRQQVARPSTPRPQVRVAGASRARGLPPGLSGSLLLLTGSAAGLPGGPSGQIVWMIDLSTGTTVLGSGEASPFAPGTPLTPFGYPGIEYGFPGPPPIAASTQQAIVLESSGQSDFLATAPLRPETPASGSFADTPLLPVAAAGNFTIGPNQQVAFVNDLFAEGGRAVQQVGVVGRPFAYQGRGSRLQLSNAYPLRRGLYVSAAHGNTSRPRSARPVIARVSKGRLKVALAGWLVVAEDPTGLGLLVLSRPTFASWGAPLRRAYLWSPGSEPRPFLPQGLSVREILAWSRDGRTLLVSGDAVGRTGLFLASSGHETTQVSLPPNVDPTSITSAALAGDYTVFFTDGLALYSCTAGGPCGEVAIWGMAGKLPALGVAYAPTSP